MTSEARNTKYSHAVLDTLQELGHATNAQLLERLRLQFPELSATTVHRITARFAERGVAGLAPSTPDGSMRYDAVVEPHDHFVCHGCDNIRDIDVAPALIPQIEAELGGCKISGRLMVSGTCGHCLTKDC